MDQTDPRRPVGVTVTMVIFGIILLLPGVCSVVFMAGMGVSGADPVVGLWAICFLISLGGVWLLIRAFR
jgi:lipopolysaccharide export LptBFGC system permease protein LptF